MEKKAEETYEALAGIPSPTTARFITQETLTIDYTIRTTTRATQSYHRDHPEPLRFIDKNILHQSLSPSGKKLAIFRSSNQQQQQNLTQDQPKPQLRIELWDNSTNAVLGSYDLSSAHRPFILNATFGYPTWNSFETQLAYVAERLPAESSSWLDRNRYRPSFGEQFNEIRSPAIFILSIDDHPASPNKSRPPRVVELTPQSDSDHPSTLVAYAQPVFGTQSGPPESGHHQIFCTGLASLPDQRRLGLIYCQNRPSAIYELVFELPVIDNKKTLNQKPIESAHPIRLQSTRISNLDRSARSPYVVDDRIVYLSNPIGGPHASCASFHLYNAQSKQHVVLLGPVDEPRPPNPQQPHPFAGLYLDQLTCQPRLVDPTDPDSVVIVLSSIDGSRKVPMTIEMDSGHLARHEPPGDCSATLLGTDGTHQALFSISRTNLPPQIWIATLSRSNGLSFSWRMVCQLGTFPKIQTQLSKIESRIIKLPANDLGPTEIVLTTPTVELLDQLGPRKSSLIIVPHGGPHSTSVNEFSASTAAMALLGYSTAYINYPGSLGFGQKWILELPKNLGTADVESCRLALEHLLSLELIENLGVEDRIFISGGSHGGFITAHLTSRYPDLFRAACLRNPVVDLVGTASGGSDIPDWSYAEANLGFPVVNGSEPTSGDHQPGKVSVSEEDFKVLRDKSPIRLVHQVKIPTLMLLGTLDQRVSNVQGLAWFHGLKNSPNRPTAEAAMFPNDSHPLSSPAAALNSFMICAEFFAPFSHAPSFSSA